MTCSQSERVQGLGLKAILLRIITVGSLISSKISPFVSKHELLLDIQLITSKKILTLWAVL